jgi:hypothetical protein
MNIYTKTLALTVLAFGVAGTATAPAVAGCTGCGADVVTWGNDGQLGASDVTTFRQEFYAGEEVFVSLSGWDDYADVVDMDVRIWRGNRLVAEANDVGNDAFYFYPEQDGNYRVEVINATVCDGFWKLLFEASQE